MWEATMAPERRHIELTEKIDCLPIPWQPRRRRPVSVRPIEELGAAELLAACQLLSTRGSGQQAWTVWYRHDPVAFLLDAMEEAVTLWTAEGHPIFRNRTAEAFNVAWRGYAALESFQYDDHELERRCLAFTLGSRDYVLEIIRPGIPRPSAFG
jgi:hypothetical protein